MRLSPPNDLPRPVPAPAARTPLRSAPPGRAAVALGAALAFSLATGCTVLAPPPGGDVGPEPPPSADQPAEPGVPAEPAEPEPGEPEPEPTTWAERTLADLTLREKIGQLVMPIVLGDYAPEGSASHDRIVRLIEAEGIGGVIVSVGSPTDVAVKLNDLQRHARVPLLVAADLETGAGFRLRGAIHSPTNIVLGGATEFPSLMAVGATDSPALAYEMGRITAVEARAVGIHVTFAPVLDVNSNPANPIINVRSFGEDPERVATLGAALVRGMEEHGVVATGKHFPGHGDTETDSHLELPVIRASRDRLDTLELVPFQRAIDEGMSGVMTAHIAVPSLSGGDGVPSTLSPQVLTELLREEMGFRGLLFTDAMDMGAIDRRYPRGEAAVRAIEAGADVILMPPNVGAAVDAVMNAVAEGRLPEERIDRSVRRVLLTKERLGLGRDPTVSVDDVIRYVGIPDHVEVAREIAERSLTLLKNERGLLPLAGTRSARVLSVNYRRRNDLLAGRFFNARLRSTYPRLQTTDVERDTPAATYDQLLGQARSSDLVVVSLYVTAVSYSGSVAVPETVSRFIRELARARIPHVVVSFGNPYLLREFPDAQAYLLAWSGADVSQRAAAGALLGDFDVTGRTPTRIPPFFEIGDGIRLPRKGAAGGG